MTFKTYHADDRVTVRLCGTIHEFLYGANEKAHGVIVGASPDYRHFVVRLDSGRQVLATHDYMEHAA